MKSERNRVAIIGAGPAGLTVAYELMKRGILSDVYEVAARTGGLSSSQELWGARIDFGPHAFYSNSYPPALAFWKEINGEEFEMTVPKKGILFRKKILIYPFRPADFILKAG